MENVIKCKHCNGKNFIKKGLRQTQNRGKIQVYRCLDCGKKFTNDEGFYRMRNNPEKITSAIDLYFSNLSSRKVRNYFRRHLEHNSSHVTVLDWARRYTLKVHNYVNKLQPKLSGQYYADETEIDRGKVNDKFWCCVDWETRFIVDTHYSLTSNIEEAKTFLEKVKQKGKPKYIQTDSAMFYPQAMRKVFSSHSYHTTYHGEPRVKHIVNNVHKTGRHNVRIETVFSKIKDRVDDFRGLKALWSAPILMAGIVLQHNYIEEHTTTGKVPCELANLKLETGQNRWLRLIRLASN
ncbi:IS1/IS6 family transposase [Candidatus Woesearchaeota archaeon]|nr:IS1/IS6 family transposase [Candidatus Woesearchaeota archaeon]